MNDDTNPRAVAGANNPPIWAILRQLPKETNFPETVAAYLREEYKAILDEVPKLLEEARLQPAEIDDEASKTAAASIIKRMRELVKKLDGAHGLEKLAYWTGGQATDQTFFGPIDKLARRDRKAKAGAADILNARITDYDNRVLAVEQERRRRIADEEARIARAAAEEEARLLQEAEEARLAAERARAPAQIEQKEAVAEAKEDLASAAKVDTTVAMGRAEAAHIDTLAKPADIMRKRDETEGFLTTVAQEGYAELLDRDKVDLEKLRPYLKTDAIEVALRAYAKATDYRGEIVGAKIGKRNKSVVR